MSRRPDVFLYQSTVNPIVLGELPVVPVIFHEEHALTSPVDLITGGAPFNHFIPEVFVAPAWIQDFSIHPRTYDLIEGRQFVPKIITPPSVFPDAYLIAEMAINVDRKALFSDIWVNQWDPSAASEVEESVVDLDYVTQVDVPPRLLDLISDIGYQPLRDAVILPQAAPTDEIAPLQFELLGTDPVVPPQFLTDIPPDWLPNTPDVAPVVNRLLGQATFPVAPQRSIYPDVIGYFEGLSREDVQQISEQVDSWFQSGVDITPDPFGIRICNATTEPVIAIAGVSCEPLIDLDGVQSEGLIGIDGVSTEEVC